MEVSLIYSSIRVPYDSRSKTVTVQVSLMYRGSIWVPYDSRSKTTNMGAIWVPYDSRSENKEKISCRVPAGKVPAGWKFLKD